MMSWVSVAARACQFVRVPRGGKVAPATTTTTTQDSYKG